MPQIAVVCILLFKDNVLLLSRKKPPLCWGPPGGYIKRGESVVDALHRELKEETGLQCHILLPVNVWEGLHNNKKILSITFVCQAHGNSVVLSKEHSEYKWVPIDTLQLWKDKTDMDVLSWKRLIEAALSFVKK